MNNHAVELVKHVIHERLRESGMELGLKKRYNAFLTILTEVQWMSSRLENSGEFITGRQINLRDWYLEYRLMKGCFVALWCWLPWKHIFMYSH